MTGIIRTRRKVEAHFVRPGDVISVGGAPFEVGYSEPWADHEWVLEGAFIERPNGEEPYTTTLRVPARLRLMVGRS